MKRTTTLALMGCMIFAGSRSNAQSQGALAGAYDFGLKEAAAIATVPAGKLTNVLGLGFDLDVDGFGGTSVKTKTPIVGGFVGKRFALANEAAGYLGLGLSLPQGRSFGFAIGAGVSWRF